MKEISNHLIDILDTKIDTFAKSYQFILENDDTRLTTVREFKTFKLNEAALEDKSEFLIIDSSTTIRSIEIKNNTKNLKQYLRFPYSFRKNFLMIT